MAASTSRLAISPAYFATARPAKRVCTAGGNATLTSTPTAAPMRVSTIRPTPVDSAASDVPDAEHEHRADRHLQQVRAEPQDLAADDRGGDEDAEAPPVQPDHRHEADRQRHAEHHREHPLHAVDQRARQGGLHHEQGGERGDQRRRIGEAHGLGHDERGHGGAAIRSARNSAVRPRSRLRRTSSARKRRTAAGPRRHHGGGGHPPMPTQRVRRAVKRRRRLPRRR